MRKLLVPAAAATLLVAASMLTIAALPPAGPVSVRVSGEAREEINTANYLDRYKSLADYVATASGVEVKLSFGRDLGRELQRTRSGGYDLIIGPAHVIATAVRYGYEPIVRFPGEEVAVFVATESSGIESLESARGVRLATPPADSLATYLARGELNTRGVTAKTFFKQIREYRYHEAALLALEFGQADVAVADRRLAEEWLKRNKGRILFETKSAPGTGVAVLASLGKRAKERIRTAFLAPDQKAIRATQLASLDLTKMEPITAVDYEYVSTLGYYTPRVLDGAKVITAAEAEAFMRQGVPVFDTRSKQEYNDKRIKGAQWLPYGEKSHKDVDFESAQDKFDLGGLPQDKGAPVILACNGEECWKSYKASVVAMKAGHKQVYWLRGGFPEWKANGLPIE